MSCVIHGLKRSSVIHGIIGYAFTIFGLESSESVSASFKSENKFENERKMKILQRRELSLAVQLQRLLALLTQLGISIIALG